jgi:hypothetical protein
LKRGQAGDGSNSQRNSPTKVSTENFAMKNIFIGYSQSFMLRNDTMAFGFGSNDVKKIYFYFRILNSVLIPMEINILLIH